MKPKEIGKKIDELEEYFEGFGFPLIVALCIAILFSTTIMKAQIKTAFLVCVSSLLIFVVFPFLCLLFLKAKRTVLRKINCRKNHKWEAFEDSYRKIKEYPLFCKRCGIRSMFPY